MKGFSLFSISRSGDVTLTEMIMFQSDSIQILFKFNTMVWNVVALSSVKSGPTFQTRCYHQLLPTFGRKQVCFMGPNYSNVAQLTGLCHVEQ